MATPYTFQVLLLLLSISTTLNFKLCKGELNILCNENERKALLSFKHGLIDPSKKLSSWSEKEDCCKWPGVRCNNITGRVVELNLSRPLNSPYVGLTGEISPSLLELKSLSHLDLSSNYFILSQIPKFLGSMESLIYLDLSYIGFVGLIPHQLGNLSHLQYLNIGYDDDLWVDNLNWMSGLSSLKYLDLSGVNLHAEIAWLQVMSTLPSLSELHLENCRIDKIILPEGQTNFTSLRVLDLSNNNLNQEIPPWLFNLSIGLEEFKLGSNSLQGEIPQVISKLQNLRNLDLHGNQLGGKLPYSLGQLKQLEGLDLSNNFFTGPISSLANLSSLRVLNLGHNKLNGTVPMSFGSLQNLQGLYLGDNYLTGGVPKTVGILSNLMTLDLASNFLEGPVNEVYFRKLSKLKELRLYSTNLLLSVNTSWVPPFQLEYLLVSSCRVGPKFPLWLQTQRSIKVLSMSKSGISDMTPSWFWNWSSKLEFLDISGNQIRGDLSSVFLNSRYVILNFNYFEGQLPRVSAHVEVLNVANNSISGPISPFFCERVNGTDKLSLLDVSNNLLSGELGHCWKHWQALTHLNLGRNNLSGEIPESIGYLFALESLQLDNNAFRGHIPSTLKNCSALKFIDMGDNQISGTIPVWIWEMQNLMVLRMRSNQFKGNIAEETCQLFSLIVLDLANNNLSGTVPKWLVNLTAMIGEDDMFANPLQYTFGFDMNYNNYKDSLVLVPKGHELEYRENLILVRMIDLSSNKLSGSIPPEISCLSALNFLNLSRNNLSGGIPKEMGDMKFLESIDLSANHLSGEIPQSFSGLSFLSYLNLSNNNLSGRIPTGTQLQSFDALNFAGNPELCGLPLTNKCPGEQERGNSTPNGDADVDFFGTSEMYMGMGAGFATGFWGICCSLFFIRTWRHAYFQFIFNLKDRFYVVIVLTFRWLLAKISI